MSFSAQQQPPASAPDDLPDKVYLIIGFFHGLRMGMISVKDTGPWNKELLTHEEYEQLFASLSSLENQGLYEFVRKLRFDWFSREGVVAFRLSTPKHDKFLASVQARLQEQIIDIEDRSDRNDFLQHVYSLEKITSLPETPSAHRSHHAADILFYYHHKHCIKPPVVIEICDARKAQDMQTLAEAYMRQGRGETRVVVGIDMEGCAVSVWRYLRYLPTLVDGVDYRRCIRMVDSEPFRQENGGAADGALVLSVKDFLPRYLPFDASDREVQKVLRQEVSISYEALSEMLEYAEGSGGASDRDSLLDYEEYEVYAPTSPTPAGSLTEAEEDEQLIE